MLREQVKTLQERMAKDSYNSSLPPSSDRFVRQPKGLRLEEFLSVYRHFLIAS